jgi:LytS/YehU family sensor histidine kinase
MLAQPFLENSIEHGLFKSSNQGQISILYKKKNSYLILEVEDNGIGLQPQTNEGIHESLAIKITSERISVLKTLFGKNTTFEIINKEDLGKGDQGVKVVFKIPFKTEI